MPKLNIEIDSDSGFCFGVVNAIEKAEKELESGGDLYCLGDIVHNGDEVRRLSDKGLRVIGYDAFPKLSGARVLLRAHGEPPSTYKLAERMNVRIVDATCPVVLQLQKKIKKACDDNPNSQIVIYGKRGHAEVNGLVGQTNGSAVVVEGVEDSDAIAKIDFSRDIILFSQTTKSIDGFDELCGLFRGRMTDGAEFKSYDTICRQVAGRKKKIEIFAGKHDVIIFVGGDKSSNAKALFGACLAINSKSHFVQNASQLKPEWFEGASSVGICGATSTPRWQMEEITVRLRRDLFGDTVIR